jgi:catechol 2,3-dioxygenase-like lactoylglutathione lyase family enzyme
MTERSVTYTPSHFGLCVTDLERSLRFYRDGLGFEVAECYEVGNEFADALEVEGKVDVVSQFIRSGGMAIELLYYRSPGTHGRPSASRNQLGLTHLSFSVDDVEAAARWLEDCGGTRLPSTYADTPGAEILFIEDPDGVRVELMRLPS